MTFSFRQFVLLAAILTLLGTNVRAPAQSPTPKTLPPASRVTYEDVTQKSGINFKHSFGEQKLSSIMEATGSGCAWIDYNNDGLLDLYVVSGRYVDGVTKFSKPDGMDATNHLYRNNGDGTFTDAAFESGVGIINQYVAWGCGFLDYDNDGWPDILQVNGHVYPEIETQPTGQSFKNPRLVYKNLGGGRFKDVSAELGPGISERFSSRGAALGDYDNDGDIDALILNMSDLPSLLRNDGGNAQNWIKIKLIGTKCNRTAIGARVRVVTGNHSQIDEVHSGGSVMSQSDLRLHFGLGKTQVIDALEVKWPTTQKVERFTQVKANQILTIREGSGIVDTFKPNSK